MRLDRHPNILDRGTCSSQCVVNVCVCVWLMLGSFIMRVVKLGVRWCSCWDTISIQRYLSRSLKILSALKSYQYKMIYVYIYCVCLYLHCLPVAGSRPIFQLANICLTNTQTRNETQFLIICSVVVILLVLPLLSFVLFFVVFVLFAAAWETWFLGVALRSCRSVLYPVKLQVQGLAGLYSVEAH